MLKSPFLKALRLFSYYFRGLANGILSWGVYYGYGLAYVYGIYVTNVSMMCWFIGMFLEFFELIKGFDRYLCFL